MLGGSVEPRDPRAQEAETKGGSSGQPGVIVSLFSLCARCGGGCDVELYVILYTSKYGS